MQTRNGVKTLLVIVTLILFSVITSLVLLGDFDQKSLVRQEVHKLNNTYYDKFVVLQLLDRQREFSDYWIDFSGVSYIRQSKLVNDVYSLSIFEANIPEGRLNTLREILNANQLMTREPVSHVVPGGLIIFFLKSKRGRVASAVSYNLNLPSSDNAINIDQWLNEFEYDFAKGENCIYHGSSLGKQDWSPDGFPDNDSIYKMATENINLTIGREK